MKLEIFPFTVVTSQPVKLLVLLLNVHVTIKLAQLKYVPIASVNVTDIGAVFMLKIGTTLAADVFINLSKA